MTSKFIDLSLSLLGNPLLRALLISASHTCDKCGRSKVEIAIEKLIDRDAKACVACNYTSSIIAQLLKAIAVMLHIPEDSIKELLAIGTVRKALLSTIKGIALFGVKHPQPIGAPFLVVWDLTNMCNLRCKHCYRAATPTPAPTELSTEGARMVIRQLADAGVPILSFSGGEPLMRRDFFEICKCALDHDFYISVATNGTLITRGLAERMADAGVQYVDISVDSSKPEYHDAFRGVDGSWKRAVRAIRYCKDAGMYVCMATTVTKINHRELPSIVKLAEDLQVNRIVIFNYIPTGRASEASELDLSPEERERVLEYLYAKLAQNLLENKGIQAFATAPQYAVIATGFSATGLLPVAHTTALHGSAIRLARFIGGCGAGTLYCSITPEGYVQPCVFLPIKIGDLRRDRFEDIWIRSKVLNDLRHRERFTGPCGKCCYRDLCGGCRARAYAYSHDYMGYDPGCCYGLILENPREA